MLHDVEQFSRLTLYSITMPLLVLVDLPQQLLIFFAEPCALLYTS
jgi:hypothetical protein